MKYQIIYFQPDPFDPAERAVLGAVFIVPWTMEPVVLIGPERGGVRLFQLRPGAFRVSHPAKAARSVQDVSPYIILGPSEETPSGEADPVEWLETKLNGGEE